MGRLNLRAQGRLLDGGGHHVGAQRNVRRQPRETRLFLLCLQGLDGPAVESEHIRHVRDADLRGEKVVLKFVGVGNGREQFRSLLAAGGETSLDTGKISASLGQHGFPRRCQGRLRRLDIRIVGERTFDQIVERLGLEQSPPISRNVLARDETLGFSAGHVGRAARGRNRIRCVIMDRRGGWFLEIRPHRATGEKHRNSE